MDLIQYHIHLRIKTIDGKQCVWDIVRKKWIVIVPEEMVRQCIIHYLIEDRKYPIGSIAVEKQIKYHQLSKRFDIVIYDKNVKPVVLIECKAPRITINHQTIEQILTYQEMLQSQYIWITNGPTNLVYEMKEDGGYEEIDELPISSDR